MYQWARNDATTPAQFHHNNPGDSVSRKASALASLPLYFGFYLLNGSNPAKTPSQATSMQIRLEQTIMCEVVNIVLAPQ